MFSEVRDTTMEQESDVVPWKAALRLKGQEHK